ncbi:HAMP domain-containing histidine kinase [Luteolibacter pohnpeiensis]|uniref:histidine kinase n=1 Tax=Luteolibacter pohnpeiensis TaxID=454153 RepID=A0A934S4W4_9BACT|nr:HAMP domain-containing sensor histidine kinase [Luteolibacter pohnpeiensis]MBK1881204.1 HAMP domain-containing histidine kinase [Luteolibacter pohnpeiensis]
MNRKPKFPMLAKVAAFLVLHLVVLTAVFFIFITWQLRLGLDSILSASANERLRLLGNELSADLSASSENEWEQIIQDHVSSYGLVGYLRREPEFRPGLRDSEIPGEIIARLKQELPPHPRGRRESPLVPRQDRPGPELAQERRPIAETKVHFLIKDREQGAYWACISIPIDIPTPEGPQSTAFLFLKSDSATANGLFFDYRPWLFGGLAVLALSIALWTPFVLGITRYASRISKATASIADGNFDTRIGAKRNDELGLAGDSIEEMSARLGHFINGQRRFLGDVAHELCTPLARVRTGMGILENGLDEHHRERLASIEEDAEELSTLVSELLAFTKATSSTVHLQEVELEPIISQLTTRELSGHELSIELHNAPPVRADQRLLVRAILNILRNCHRHGGETCEVHIRARSVGDFVTLTIEDNGPGVPAEEHSRLFEPFYRPDRSRNRETGGTGLGMAIVESSIRACGGKVSAAKSSLGGLMVKIELPKA